MIERLPFVRPFTPAGLRWRLVDSRIEGPDGFGVPAEAVTTDGGGWWTAEFSDMLAGRPEHHRALRAMAMRLRGGRRIDVPFVEQQATGGVSRVPFSDDATFSDGALWTSGAMSAVLEEAVSLRADTAKIRILTDHVLTGGDVFSLDRSGQLGSEMKATGGVTHLGGGVWEVELGPQFRQAHDAGAVLNFNAPLCAMRLNDPEGGLWPKATRGWNLRASARFEEAVR